MAEFSVDSGEGTMEGVGGLNVGERKTILLVTSVSRYASSDKYIGAWSSVLRKLGCNTCILDAWSLAQPTLCNYVISTHQFDAVLDLNGMCCSWGVTKDLPPKTIYSMYLCDPPAALQENLEQADDRTVVFGCDRNFCDYMERYFSIKHTEFIPLSGNAYPIYTPYEERTIDIIFTGTYEDPEQIKEKELARFEEGSVLRRFLEDMMEDIIINPQYTLPECLSRILTKYQQEVSDSEFADLTREFLMVDYYARFYYREKVIRSLLSAGLTIHVYGNGWEDFHSEYKENLVICKGGYHAAEKALANAKIALNIMPWFKDAFQERIASAMLSKTVAVTDESKYINENFEDNKELLIFSLKDIDSLAGRIKYLLEHPQEASDIAEHGYQKVQNHTWECRTRDMVRKIEKDFGITFMQEGEGRELEFELEYPDFQTARLDAIYELHKMSALVDNDIGKMEEISDKEIELLIKNFDKFKRKFSSRIEGMEMNDYILDCMHNPASNNLKHIVELFSIQCKALMGKLLLEEKNVRL